MILREIAQNLAMAVPPVRRLAATRHDALGDERVTNLQKFASYRRHLADLGSDLIGKNVLELGPGRDLGSLRMALAEGARTCAAVDVLPYVTSEPKIEYRLYNGQTLPFSDACFDVIWSWAVMEHTRRPRELASEMFRTLRPGGVVLARVDLRDHYHLDDESRWNEHLDWSEFWWRAQKWWRAAYTNRLRLSEWISLMAEAGFAGGAKELQRSSRLADISHRWPWLTAEDAAVFGFDGVWIRK